MSSVCSASDPIWGGLDGARLLQARPLEILLFDPDRTIEQHRLLALPTLGAIGRPGQIDFVQRSAKGAPHGHDRAGFRRRHVLSSLNLYGQNTYLSCSSAIRPMFGTPTKLR